MGSIVVCVFSYLNMIFNLFSVYSSVKKEKPPGCVLLYAMTAACWSTCGTVWLIRMVKGW